MSKVTVISTDPIADMLTRIRNAVMVNAPEVRLPHSKLKQTIAQILASNGFLEKVNTEQENGRPVLSLTINTQDDSPKITEIARLSRPGRRMYVKADAIPTVKNGRGMVVISTSGGIMSGAQAKAKNLGGELICEVY
ncbi:MAG TPA: 30S ribosomal protein S8 [Candidatus Saccharimonadales bacterium]|nr:30S ribosomal protein S8 [Candidatus Saccharimonadales bacterium]